MQALSDCCIFFVQPCSQPARACPIPCLRRSSRSCGLGTQEVWPSEHLSLFGCGCGWHALAVGRGRCLCGHGHARLCRFCFVCGNDLGRGFRFGRDACLGPLLAFWGPILVIWVPFGPFRALLCPTYHLYSLIKGGDRPKHCPNSEK